MSHDNNGRLLHLATKVLTQKALERAHGGWIPEKHRIQKEREALRAQEKQKREAEKRSKLQTGGIPDEEQPYDLGQQLQTGARFAAEIPASVNRVFVEPVTTSIQELMRPVFEGEKYSADPETGEVRSSYQTPEMVEHSMNAVGGIGAGSLLTGPSATATNVLRSGMGPVAKETVAQAPQRSLSPLGFYSQAAEHAATLQPRGDAAQMVAALRNAQNIKAEELMNAGLIDAQGNVHPEWAKRGKVTREDIISHLQGQMPQLEETVLGRTIKGQPYPEEYEKMEQAIIDKYKPELDRYHQIYTSSDFPQHERNAAMQARYDLQDKMYAEIDATLPPDREQLLEASRDIDVPTKYQDYTLPGGKNYREVLLRLPEQQKKSTEYPVIRPDGLVDGIYDSIQNAARRAMEINGSVGDPINIDRVTGFRSPHWGDLNVLAHIRMADRIVPPSPDKIMDIESRLARVTNAPPNTWGAGLADLAVKKGAISPEEAATYARQKGWSGSEYFDKKGLEQKVLHVEELQSDWGQKGKKTGFESQRKELNQDVINKEKASIVAHQLGMSEEEKAARLAAYNEANARLEAFEKNGRAVPDAPYVTSTEGWTDLALKRVLKEAAEGGYDKVVWTPGAEQAKRYDLSKQVDSLLHKKNPDGTYQVSAQIQGRGQILGNGSLSESELADHVGKEIAEKIAKQEGKKINLGGNSSSQPEDFWHKLSGDNLKIGGEGMKGYYDTIVPKRLQNIAKKYDKEARLGYTSIAGKRTNIGGMPSQYPEQMQLPSIDITPAMRESILRGQSAYQRGGAVRKDFKQAHADARSHGLKTFTWTDPATGEEGTYTTALKRREGGRVYSLADHNQWKEPS